MSEPENAEVVASLDLFPDLVEQWERRCVTLDKLAAEAEKTACEETIARLKTKAGVTRAMTGELKREIRKSNRQARPPRSGGIAAASREVLSENAEVSRASKDSDPTTTL